MGRKQYKFTISDDLVELKKNSLLAKRKARKIMLISVILSK